MSANFPTSLDVYAALVDNTDNIIAAHPNNRGDAIEALQAKVGVDSSAVTSSHDYKFTHLPGQAQNLDIGAYELRAQTLESDVATGTPPIAIASTTPVDNLGIYFDHATIASEARGDLLYRAASAWARRAKGTLGQVLTMGANDPVWSAASVVVGSGNYTGDATAGTSVAHGLGVKPSFWICGTTTDNNSDEAWWITGMGATIRNSRGAAIDSTTSTPDATNFYLGDTSGNRSGATYYWFAIG